MNFKKSYSIIFTSIFFLVLVSSFTPVGALESSMPEEDFSTSPTPKATGAVKAATTSPTARGNSSASNTNSQAASQSGTARAATANKSVVYKGEVSATPSAVGKFLVKTTDGDKNVDTDRSTKVYSYDTGRRVATTVSRLKVSDKVVVIGEMTADNKSLLAKFIMVRNKVAEEPKRGAMYGIVESREASGSNFSIQVKNPKGDQMTFAMNSSTTVTVKDLESPKLSDIKIGDRVTLTYTTANDTNTATRVHAIPGRAAGLLRDIRESSESASASPSAKPSTSASASPSGNVRGASTTPKATASPKATTKATVKPSTTSAQ